MGGSYNDNVPKRRERRVVWALGEFFFSSCFFLYLMTCIDTIDSLKVRCGSTQATTMATGPNDVRHVVWALDECFLSFSFISFILIVIYRYYNSKNSWKGSLKVQRGMEGNDKDNGPKRGISCCLGH